MTYTVIAYVTTIVINLMVGISQGSQPLVSYHYGKEDHTGCQKLLRYALTTVCIFAPALFLLVFFFAPQIVRTYLSHAGDELIAYSIGAFRRYSVSYLLLGFNIVIGGFMTAIERPVPAICISVGRGLALQSAVLLLLAGDLRRRRSVVYADLLRSVVPCHVAPVPAQLPQTDRYAGVSPAQCDKIRENKKALEAALPGPFGIPDQTLTGGLTLRSQLSHFMPCSTPSFTAGRLVPHRSLENKDFFDRRFDNPCNINRQFK